tara:strand:+ start:687 stop:1940 length:1254 start_codon:yes stop_codon:yes gene_type:complete
METDWVTKEASEFCSSVRDGTHGSPKEVFEGGKKLVTSRHIKGGTLDFTNSYKISIKDFNEINQRSKVNQWDVLFSMIGTIGEVLLVKEKEPDYAIKNVGLFKCKSELDGQWLYYYLNSPPVKREILSLSRGTTQQYIPLGSLRKLSIRCPNSDLEKEKIIRFLSYIDEKIEINKKSNETLEGIAKAIFKSWFIDFDPVKAKSEGRSTGLPNEISDLFPDSFEDSELGQIPSGWIIQSLGSISKIFTGKRPKSRSKKETPLTKYPLYGGAGPMGFTNDILVNGSKIITTGRVGTLGKFFRIKIPAWISDNALIIEPSDIFYNFCFYRLLNFDITIFNRGSTQPLITQSDLKTIEMISADEKIHKIFEKLCSDLYEKFAINQSESNTLENIRNCLLPKLISGELKIPDAEKIIEAIGI